MIDLKEALRRELKANSSQTFKFELPGDQIIFVFKSRRTVKHNGAMIPTWWTQKF
jgi:hypothetical protein